MENDVVRRSYLKVTASKGLIGSLSRFGSKKSWVVLRRDSRSSRARVEIFKEEDDYTKRQQPIKLISVDQISSISTSPEKKEIVITIGIENMVFSFSSKADVDDWLRDIDSLRKNGCAFNKRGSGEEGASFSPYPEEEVFKVKLRQSSSLLFHGQCILEVHRDFERNLFHLALFSEDSNRRSIVKWQIDHIRQYGSNHMAFKFQSGSKSPTGVDWFILETEPGDAPRIHRAVDFWARHIVDQASNLPQLPSRRSTPPVPYPRNPTSPIPSPPGKQIYEKLLPTEPNSSAVYEDLNVNTDNRHHTPQNQTTLSSSLPGNVAYQPIIRHGSYQDNPYADLNEITRDRSISVSTTSSNQNQEYMPLNETTRSTSGSIYMGVNPSR